MALTQIGTYTARRVGTSIVLTCPVASERCEYDLFRDDETGALIYVNVEDGL